MQGKIDGYEEMNKERIFYASMDTSEGQSGGALVNPEDGKVYGIYTGIGYTGNMSGNSAMCIAITDKVVEFVKELCEE